MSNWKHLQRQTAQVWGGRRNRSEVEGEADDRDLTTGSITGNIWRLAAPTMVGNLLFVALYIVDMFFVGKIGLQALATIALAQTIINLMWIVVEGISTATQAMVARAVGERDSQQARDVAIQSLFMGLVSSLLVGGLGFAFAEQLFRLLGAASEVVSIGAPYLRVMVAGSITMNLSFLASAILRGAGDVIRPMKIFAVCTVLNIILDPLLIFGLWVFPQWGVVGSAVACVISRTVGMGLAFFVLFTGRSRREVHLNLRGIRLNFPLMWEMLKIGVYQSIEMVQWTFKSAILMRVAGIFGTVAQAAIGVGFRAGMLVEIVSWGLGISSATLVGQNLGAKQHERAEESARLAVRFGQLVALGAGVIVFIFAQGVMGVFTQEPELIRVGAAFLRWLSPTYVFTALWMVLSRSLKGAGDTRSPMVITLIALFGLQIPSVLILVLALNMGTNGIWMGMAFSNVIAGLMTYYRFNQGKWKDIRFGRRFGDDVTLR